MQLLWIRRIIITSQYKLISVYITRPVVDEVGYLDPLLKVKVEIPPSKIIHLQIKVLHSKCYLLGKSTEALSANTVSVTSKSIHDASFQSPETIRASYISANQMLNLQIIV